MTTPENQPAAPERFTLDEIQQGYAELYRNVECVTCARLLAYVKDLLALLQQPTSSERCDVSVTGKHRIDVPYCKDCGQQFPCVYPATDAGEGDAWRLANDIAGAVWEKRTYLRGVHKTAIVAIGEMARIIEPFLTSPAPVAEGPELCGVCLAAGRVYCPPDHHAPVPVVEAPQDADEVESKVVYLTPNVKGPQWG